MYDFLVITETRPRHVFEPVFTDVSADQYALRMTPKKLNRIIAKQVCGKSNEVNCYGCEFSVYKVREEVSK